MNRFTRPSLTGLLLLLSFFAPLSFQRSDIDIRSPPLDPNVKELFPEIYNIAAGAIITANATCGETRPELYCELTATNTQIEQESNCFICDATSLETDKKHPISYAIDGTRNWWQSPSIQNGKKFEWVTVTLDLRQVYQIAYVSIKAATSPLPGNWILERSLDGIDYKPWQYYAISHIECWEAYHKKPVIGIPQFYSDDEVVCVSQYPTTHDLANGEIHTSLIYGRPSARKPSETLREFTKARFVRLRLQKNRGLQVDLQRLRVNDADSLDSTITRRHYYTLQDITVGGYCLCNGHSKSCVAESGSQMRKCVCENNTCGDSCERCCPFFHQKPYRPASAGENAVCESCNCFGHSDECYYDPKVAAAKSSLNIHGVYEGGGVCVKCKHFTTGINCEQCQNGYYRPNGVRRDDREPCRKCDCFGLGKSGNCIKDDTYLAEGVKPGTCICKEGYAGPNCDRCAPGYKNYPRCEPCYCNHAGIINTESCDGPCICKANVEGSKCDRCKSGFYNLNAKNPDGCSECWCNGLTKVCKPSDWGKEVIYRMKNWLISDLDGRIIVKPTEGKDRFLIAEDDMTGTDVYYWKAPEEYLGDKLYSYGGDLRFTLGYTVLRGDTSGFFTEEADVILEGGTEKTRIGFNWKKHSKEEEGKTTISIPLIEQGWFKIGRDKSKLGPVSRAEFALITHQLNRLLIRAKFHTDQIEGALFLVTMEKGVNDTGTLRPFPGIEMCDCPPGYLPPSCIECAKGYRRVSDPLFGIKCVKCDCHNHAESCDAVTGKCQQPCLHNTVGEDCGSCKPGYYGNAKIGKPDDCKKCACPLEIESNNFAPTCFATGDGYDDYTCPCSPGYKKPKCRECEDGYYGNPLIPGSRCLPCDCGFYNGTAQGLCDKLTGQCFCRGNTGGPKCCCCLENHWGDPTIPDCKPCNCDPDGSESLQCDRKTGQCLCKPKYIGKYCTECSIKHGKCKTNECNDGYYGDPLLGEECKPCDCDSHGSQSKTCNKKTGQCPCFSGIGGRDCRQCPPRHVHTDHGCLNCDNDECVKLHLNTLDYLKILLIDVNITEVGNLPATRLVFLRRRREEMTNYVISYKITIERGRQLLYNVTLSFDLETLIAMLSVRISDLEEKAPNSLQLAIRVGKEADELLHFINNVFNEIQQLIDRLKNYGIGNIGPVGYDLIDRWLQEAERILIELRSRNFKPNLEDAERELRKAKALLERVMQLITAPPASREAIERLQRLQRLLSAIISLIQEKVQRPVQVAQRKLNEGSRMYQYIMITIENSTMYARIANESLEEARNLINLANKALHEAVIKFNFLPSIKADLDNMTERIEIHRSILARLNPEYTEKYVIPCQNHIKDLLHRLEYLNSLFFATDKFSDIPMRAARAYQQIIDALAAAEEAAKKAYAAAERAYREAYPGTDDSLMKQALKAKQKSYKLLEEAKRLRDVKVPEMERFLIEKKYHLDSIAEELSNSERNLELINKALDGLPLDLARILKEKDIYLRHVLESLYDVHQTIDSIDYRVRTELLPKLDRLRAGSTSGIENLTRIIEKARSEIRDASKLAFNAEEISERVNRRQAQMELDLTELRNKIKLARQKASGIRVSLTNDADGICIRSFVADIEPSTTNNIVLNYGTKDDARDALLFFMSSAINDDFMAVEMVNRKIRFLWNAGGGAQVIEHSEVIETNDQQLSKDSQWYKIEVNRVANIATLTVQRLTEAHKSDPNSVTGSSPPGFSRMDFDPDSHFYIGGLPYNFKAPRELRSRSFSGCLYEVFLGDKRVPLWNFKTNLGCGGCKQGSTETPDPTLFQFTGEGSYAILPQIRRYNKRKYLVGFYFKTFDENALLFLTSSPTSGDFISITLKEGRVFYQFNIGSAAHLELISNQKYNTGQWVRLAAQRDELEGFLSVKDEFLSTQVKTAGPRTLDLGSTQLYFGGTPPNFTFSWPTICLDHFLGCMRDIQIDTTPLDLVNADSYGVDRNCKDKWQKVVTFYGKGYLELNGRALREEADFSFTFKTSQKDALLLLSTYQTQTKGGRQKDSHYYSVAIVGGLLEARFNGGAGETTLISEVKVNDGSYHTVTISKRHRRISMTLDDRESGISRLARSTKDIEAPESGGMYLGGLLENMTLRGMAGTKIALKGIIRDFVFNGKQLKLNEPLRFEGVGIGREDGDIVKESREEEEDNTVD